MGFGVEAIGLFVFVSMTTKPYLKSQYINLLLDYKDHRNERDE